MNYQKIKETIIKNSAKIARLQTQQKKLVKEFFVLADKAKAKEILKKIQK